MKVVEVVLNHLYGINDFKAFTNGNSKGHNKYKCLNNHNICL
jgi:tRNA U38,U39,U40 pseudouridine synthase TruA